MRLTAVLFGLLLGAAIGVLVTELDKKKLHDQANYAFAWSRIKRAFNNKAGQNDGKERSGSAYLFWVAARVSTLEWVIALLVVWILLLCIWFWGFLSPVSWVDRGLLRSCFIGSLIGFLAAPWLWLHFSLGNESSSTRGNRAGQRRRFFRDLRNEASSTDDSLDRYKFLTIALGVVLGVVLLVVLIGQPLLSNWLPRTSGFELLGVKIALSSRGEGSVSAPVISTNGFAETATDRLTSNTGYARDVGNGAGLAYSDFDKLSMWNRDRAYIAYLILANHSPAGRKRILETLSGAHSYLKDYIAKANSESTASDSNIQADHKFIKATAPLFACLYKYATSLGDIRIYLVDTSSFLKHFASQVVRVERLQHHRYDPDLNSDTDAGLVTVFQGVVPELSRQIHRQPDYNPTSSVDDCNFPYAQPAYDNMFSDIPEPVPGPSGATPYPTLLVAYSLAAVNSSEAGRRYISDWIKRQGPQRSLRSRWFRIRAELEFAQMATSSILPELPPDRLVVYERRITDEFADLLGTESPQDWSALCRRLRRGDIHSLIGRRLAFTYAIARSYLFELETPGAVQTWRKSGRRDLTAPLADDLNEADAFAHATECFDDVTIFEDYRSKWKGQFELNLAQLRIDQMSRLPQGEIDAERASISRLLEEAQDHLGPAPSTDSRDTEPVITPSGGQIGPVWPTEQDASPMDQLFGEGDKFDDQRRRILALQALVANISP